MSGKLIIAVHLLVELALIIRVMLRPHRQPASRIAWVAVIAALPIIGILAYLLLGEVNIGRRHVIRMRNVLDSMPDIREAVVTDKENYEAEIPQRYAHIFKVGKSISGFDPVGGNVAHLLADSNATIDALVTDIDAAEDHVHLLFYIWLSDRNGCKVVEALKRAARRGIKCRVMADSLGSRLMLHSVHWQDMQKAGVYLAEVLPIGNTLLRLLKSRIDLRNHRKIIIIDGDITYCGSQNCADPEFRIKAKYAPWVDAVVRFEGPIARQNQYLFASDWMTYTNENIDDLLLQPIDSPYQGISAQVIGTGPTVRYSAMPETFEVLIYSARDELIISTPYYAPDESIQNALCAAAYRGVSTTIIFPARNDSWVVSGASRSYYTELLQAGVTIFEYVGGLLHTKSLTLDGQVSLIGSANMDRRSFDLNYENNILLYDSKITQDIRDRQQQYIANSELVTLTTVASWSIPRRLWNNTLALLGPVL